MAVHYEKLQDSRLKMYFLCSITGQSIMIRGQRVIWTKECSLFFKSTDINSVTVINNVREWLSIMIRGQRVTLKNECSSLFE